MSKPSFKILTNFKILANIAKMKLPMNSIEFGKFEFGKLNCMSEKSLPVYGKGDNVRDWLYVEDHCDAIYSVLKNGEIGDTYNIGGNNEYTNRDVVHIICKILDEKLPNHPEGITEYKELIQYVDDRLGHDQRYAIDSSKIQNELGWESKETFESGIEKTINWYLNNLDWVKIIQNKAKKES